MMRLLLAVLTLCATFAFAGPAPLPAPDLSTIDFRTGADPAPIPAVIGIGPTGKIYVGGAFTSVAGQARPGVARFNVDGSLDGAWNPTLPSGPPAFLAAEDASGNVALVTGEVLPLPQKHTESLLYVPAATLVGATVAAEPAGRYFQAPTFDGADLYVVSIEPTTSISQAAHDTVVRRYVSGTALDASFVLAVKPVIRPCSFGYSSPNVTGLAIQGAFVYVAWELGAFRAAKANGALDPTWKPTRPFVDPTTGLAAQQMVAKTTCFPPQTPYASLVSASPDGWIYVAGLFDSVSYGGLKYESLRRYSASDGAIDTSWSVPHASVRAMAHDAAAGHLYVALNFTNIGYVVRMGLAAISTSPGAAIVAGWEPDLESGSVQQLVRLADRLMVGGTFSTVTGATRKNAAALPLASVPPSGPAISITPPALDYGVSRTGGVRSRSATIRNEGNDTLIISAITPTSVIPTQTSHDCPSTLAPGATCSVTVQVDMSEIPFNVGVSVSSNGSAFPQSIGLRGGLWDSFLIQGPPYFTEFTRIGTSTSKQVKVTNTTVSPIELEGAFVTPAPNQPDASAMFATSNDCIGTLAPLATCTLTLTFTPTAPGYSYARLLVAGAVSGQPTNIATGGTDPSQFYGWGGYAETDYDGDGIPNDQDTLPYEKSNDIFAATDEGSRLFAMQQYRDFLGREGDASGISYWSGKLSSGDTSRASMIESFFGSQEFQGTIAPVARLYFAYFLRVPDYAGLNFWITYYKTSTLEGISNQFAGSGEFQSMYGSLDNGQFVDLVYQNVLGRAPDAGGRAYWKGQLDANAMSRGQVMLGFSESPEYRASSDSMVYVTMMYFGMLRRAPDPSGFNAWVSYRNAGNSGLALIQQFLASQEYHDRFLP